MAASLIVPVESQVRELDAKLLLACAAAERGYSVVLGSRAFVHYEMASFRRGVYLAKSMKRLSDRMFGIIRELGFRIAAFDEEGLVRFPDPYYYQTRLSARALEQVSLLLAWGPDDARVFRESPGYPGAPIHVTGNPRIDLLRPELRPYFREAVERIQARYGDFVLLNTNFGGLNHFFPKLGELKRALESDSSSEGFMAGRAAHREAIFARMLDLVPVLAQALPDLRLVVRPHPAENHAAWKNVAAGLPNVDVVNEGNVIPWLMACRALVHNGCTTAVEAAVLGTPALAYQPVTSALYDLDLPNSLSRSFERRDELIACLREIAQAPSRASDQASRRRILEGHVAALEGPLAADRMLDALEADTEPWPPAQSAPRLRRLKARAHLGLRTAVKQVNMRRRNHRNNLDFHRHRFPGITLSALRERIDRLHRVLGRFENLRVAQLSEHIFRIDAGA